MSRRRSDEVPLSLFSFQDIITSVSGIIILIVLLLGLRVATSHRSTAAPEAPELVPDRRAEVTQAEREVSELREQLASRAPAPGTPAPTATGPSDVETLRALIATTADLKQKVAASEAARTHAAEANAKLRDELRRLEEELTRTKTPKRDLPRDVWLRPDQPTDAPIILAECSRTGVRCAAWAEAGPGPVKSFAASDLAGQTGFVQYVRGQVQRDPRSKLVLLLKPSCTDYAVELVQKLQEAGVSVGYDALEESLNLFARSQP